MTDLQWRRLIEEWVRDHGRDVRAFLCHRLGNSLQVDDLLQETFCRCWNGVLRSLGLIDQKRS